MRFYSFVLALFLSLFSTASMASELLDMLKRMSEVDEKQNYQGVFILRKSDSLSTLRVTHGVSEKGVWESLEALNGEPRKVVRHNNQVVSIFPTRELVTVRQNDNNQSLHRRLPENIDQLEQYYSIHRLADDRIANHDTFVVDLVPTDKFRYGYRYWLDKNTGMLLRCDLISNDETVIEQMMFTSLDYLTETPAERVNLQQFEQFKQQMIVDNVLADAGVNESYGWIINHLPKGFMLIRSNMRYSQPMILSNVAVDKTIEDVTNDAHGEVGGESSLSTIQVAANQPVAAQSTPIQSVQLQSDPLQPGQLQSNQAQPDLLHLVYSDGLASVSVFIKKSFDAEGHFEGASSMGAINAFGNFIDNYFVTAVGVVPVNTVQTIAQSAVKSLPGLSE
jgi:negative regulator of sigma E activity